MLDDTLRTALRADDRVAAAWLFGSEARGEARPDSDIDVGVLFVDPPPRTLLGQPWTLADELGRLTGRTVDLVVLNDAPVDLIHRVLRDGRLLLGHDSPKRVRFEVRSRNEYWDILPYIELYRRGA